MKDVSKRLNENEAKIQETTINNLKLNQTGVNFSEENLNRAEIEENRLFPDMLEGNGTAENSGMKLYRLDFDVWKYRLIHEK